MDSLRFEDAALYLRVKRMEVLASNIANADTPGYQAKDIDFKAALEETQRQMLTVQSTNKSHLGNIAPTSIDPQIAFRPVSQNAMDRNTVDLDQERASFTANAIRTQFAADSNLKCNTCNQVRFADVITSFVLVIPAAPA